jgi:hypothetical protein
VAAAEVSAPAAVAEVKRAQVAAEGAVAPALGWADAASQSEVEEWGVQAPGVPAVVAVAVAVRAAAGAARASRSVRAWAWR